MARKILLADDSVTAQNMGRKILVDAGYEVIAVNNGSAALKKIAELKPDLAVLDVYMPGYSGLEVCQRLKDSPDTARIPVLLTVGKLEPFKPEEAQRVRAEGYIVKPFEASELLSALSKLEDKVVPRAEASKPGRFARAIAAAEETARGSRVEPAVKENGWKSRIGFPSKKTEPEEKNADEPSIYNPLNRDLRTVVETAAEKTADMKQHFAGSEAGSAQASRDSSTSDMPNDVTPEEVAAIAAAVAKMQMSAAAIQDDRVAEAAAQPGSHSAADSTEYHTPVPDVQGDASTPLRSAVEDGGERNKKEESIVSESAAAEIDSRSGIDDRSNQKRSGDAESNEKEEPQDIPVTMAATTDSMPGTGVSRWTAVAAVLEGHEAGLSLEQEMQKAYAAVVPYLASSATSPEGEAAVSLSLSAVAESAVEAQAAAISNPEPESAPLPEPVMIAKPTEDQASPVAQADSAEPSSCLAAESSLAAETINHAESPNATTLQPEAADVTPVASEAASVESSAEKSSMPEVASGAGHAPVDEFASPAFASLIAPSASLANLPAQAEVAASDRGAQANQAPESRPALMAEGGEATAWSAPFAPIVRAVEAQAEPKMDTEAVKSTAAAWASWRQIRDTSKVAEAPQTTPHQREDFAGSAVASEESAQEASAETEIAAAVAAGAEQTLAATVPEPAGESADVASIVDSVLADLRPKLMKEISRKMAEKK